jgi:hypothetical protein
MRSKKLTWVIRHMTADRIIAQDYEVASRLDQLGLSASDLISVVHQAVAAKAAFVLNHPLNAAGQLSYIYGTGAIRDVLRAKGWLIDRTGNIEATIAPDSAMKIVFQNADSACDDARDPKAISEKGPAASKLVDQGQHNLFPEYDLEDQNSVKRKTQRSGICSCTSTAMTFALNFRSPRESMTVSSRVSTSAFTSSSLANGPA